MAETLLEKRSRLKKELDALAKAERKEIIEQHYPQFKKRFEGKYFKYRNRYGGDSKGWWLYTKVTEIKPEFVYDTGGNGITSHYRGWSFQVTEDGNISIDKVKYGYVHSLKQEISETEFLAAWNKMIEKINTLP